MRSFRNLPCRAALLIALSAFFQGPAWADEISLGELDLGNVQQGWGAPRKDLSTENRPLTIAGKRYDRGLGTHADSELAISVGGRATKFQAHVGVDDEVAPDSGSVQFTVITDGRVAWQSEVMRTGVPAAECSVDLKGVQTLTLLVDAGPDGMNFDHADWADATISFDGEAPRSIGAPKEQAVRLTPPESPDPRINSAKVFGVRPGSPLLYLIAATGDRPMQYRAEGLPAGLSLDENTGIITGALADRGSHRVTLIATNARGRATRQLRIECGDTIALTPPMGWNSWNCFASAIDAKKVEAAADAMVSSGLQRHGWTYINIDDFWQKHRDSTDPTLGGPGRDASGNIVPNPRFPDMKKLAEYVHGKGLKIGLYSSPGPYTCGGCLGSFNHEVQDAQRYAEWGFDYLKHDWCSYRPALERERAGADLGATQPADPDAAKRPTTLAEFQKPYLVMRDALRSQNRDIVYSLCQYGMGDVWKWGAEVGGNCWRTTGDIEDTWGSVSGIGFSQAGKEAFAGPGGWNDPDMLVVGHVGWGPKLHPTRLTPNEQYTHITLWCLLASPLLIGCDMTQLDDFTLGLLTNDEVLAVNQDPLGKQASRVQQDGMTEVWAKDMEDGSKAVGLFNRGPIPASVTADFTKLGLTGPQSVRDLWRQKDIGTFDATYTAEIPRHGAALISIQRPDRR